MSQVRRSGRQRRFTKKYSLDPFKGIDDVSSDSGNDVEPLQQFEDKGNDDDFDVDQTVEAIDEHDIAPDEISDSSEISMPIDTREGESSQAERSQSGLGPFIPEEKPPVNTKFSRWRQRKEANKSTHYRGLIEQPVKNQGKAESLKHMFGSDPQDWGNYLRSRDQWINEPTLPKRNNSGNSIGGMCHHFSHDEEKRNMEASIGWDWYYDQGGRILFAERQEFRSLTPNEGNLYIPKPTNTSHKFLMGPYGKQRVFSLSFGNSLCLNEAWTATPSLGLNGEEAHTSQKKIIREGWMLNAGTSIKCLDWVPNKDGDIQYLAIATAQPEVPNKEPSKVSPAFTPLPPLKSCIQIWAFAARRAPDQGTLFDSRQPPELRSVICTDWGDIKQIEWCPMPRSFRGEDSLGETSLGLLVGIWTDGSVKVLDIQLEKQDSSATSYVKFDEPAFNAWVPNTMCTCVTWLSATDLAVGCANGFLAIWNINTKASPKPLNTDKNFMDNKHQNPSPWLYLHLHSSYILTLKSAYPSYPHLLASSSTDGYMRLTDLRSPCADSVLSTRSRIASALLCFSPPLLAFMSSEENDFLRAYSLRTFYTSTSLARANAFPLCISVGHFHPTVLFGCADGTLIATNPMRRILNRKATHYQQTVLRHEWTRQGGGMSRITEGYKAESALLQRKAKVASPSKGIRGEAVLSTIYERETGITEVVWNPNLRCGGWVAVGMGSGLVRVQDLSI